MNRLLQNTIGCVTVALCLCLPALAQTPSAEVKHFDDGGLSFDYPAGWIVTDQSTPQTQRFVLTRKGSSVEIAIQATREIILRAQMMDARRDITEPLISEIARKMGATAAKASERTPSHIAVSGVDAEGVRLQAKSGKGSKTGEVYWLRLGLRLVNLAYVRADKDEAQAAAVWKTIRESLKIETPVVGLGKREPSASSVQGQPTSISDGDSGVINGKALSLPRPVYPNIAKAARASGTVLVQVTIDEQGNVIAAHAVSGHPLLQAAAVEAARQAKFSPMLLDGEPVKLAGVITYNFLPK